DLGDSMPRRTSRSSKAANAYSSSARPRSSSSHMWLHSRGLKIAGGEIDTVLAERSWGPDQGLHALGRQRRREPRRRKRPGPRPFRRCLIETSGEMFGHGGQQGIPLFLAGRGGFVAEEAGLPLDRLPAVLLEELPDVLPSDLFIDVARKVSGEVGNGHW